MKNDIARNSLIAVAAAFAVAGCADLGRSVTPKYLTIGPDYEEPKMVVSADTLMPPDAGYPTTNKTATGEFAPAPAAEDPRVEITAEALSKWWERFADPTLANLIDSALSNNLSFLMAEKRLEAARWGYAASVGALMPHVTAAGAATRAQYWPNTSTGSSSRRIVHRDLYRAGFDMSWEIDLFGGSRREVEQAQASWESAECSLEDAWVTLTAEIGRSYIELRTIQERLDVARTNLAIQTETYDILKSRLDSGIGDELAVNQAKYNVEQTRATIPNLLTQEESYKNAIAILAGVMPGTLHEYLAPETERDWVTAPQKIGEIPLDAMRARPDLRAAERALAAQVAAVGVAKSLLFPKLYLNGTIGLESLHAKKFLRRDSLYTSIGPSISWPIFQGGRLYANFKAEEAKMNEACLRYELALQKAFEETRNAYSAYTQEYHKYQSLQGAVKAAKDAENIAQDLYKNGLSDFNNVLDAQRSLLTLSEALTISRGNITVKLIALYKALGGGIAR